MKRILTTSEWLLTKFSDDLEEDFPSQFVREGKRQDMLICIATAIHQRNLHWIPGIAAFKLVWDVLPGVYRRAAFRELWFRGVVSYHWTATLEV